MPTFDHLRSQDPEILTLLDEETARQRDGLELIPSENHTSAAVLEALASTLSDKYAEGYPGRRYYTGNEVADKVETLVQERAKKLFGVPYVNVQPYSGSPANLAVYLALLEPGETFMGLDLLAGGHLTHGWKHNATAKLWKSVPYPLNADGSFNFEEIKKLALEHKPKLIWCGGTAVPRAIPFAEFAKVADEVGAYLVADISHIAGLVAGGAHESPVPHVHLVTTTTHKTLRGPRGAMIMATEKGIAKDPDIASKIDKAIIPGLQGGPHLNTIAGIGVALAEAASPSFKTYAASVVTNAKALADALTSHGFSLVSNGTDNHLLLLDFTATGAGRGKFFHLALERIGLYANMNTVPNDQGSALYPSGLRIGTPAATTRGMGTEDMKTIANWIHQVAEHIKDKQMSTEKEARIALMKEFTSSLASDPFYTTLREEVRTLCNRFPIPGA
ncbi:MAG: serine hydroxymethyltransferase [Patescibacteria group bacterium]|jgi:glycine hydroxymethyltransferase